MFKKITTILFLLISKGIYAQNFPEFKISGKTTTKHMNILASDELQGRNTGEQGNLVAGRYIAENFRANGLKPANSGSFFQKVALESIIPSNTGEISTSEGSAKVLEDFISMSGGAIKGEFETVHLPYAWKSENYDDLKDQNIKGKVIITSVGTPDSETPNQIFESVEAKQKLAKESGAVAIIEVFNSPIPWRNISRYFGKKSTNLKSLENHGDEIPHIWISAAQAKILVANKIRTVKLDIESPKKEDILSYNIAATLEGTDPKLKSEYIILSAHYDHVGFGASQGRITLEDSIFNGARDNAFGVVALLAAAEALSELKPKRSVLFLAYTGEEMGLLGSRFYAENPLVPLNQSVFNINCDGAGYSDTTKITVIGLERAGAKAEFEKSAQAFGLEVIEDPVPEQNLFDRSDNVSLAAKGIPAPTFSPGFTAFDESISKYYHQASDNPETVSPAYLLKYAQSYAYAARLIADLKVAPKWVSGDKYEAAYLKLFEVKN